MSISPAELAALPTAPTVSTALTNAARYANEGAIPALSHAVYGSTNPDNYAALVSPEHVLAWGTALIAAARVIDPAVSCEWPDRTWPDALWRNTTYLAHRAVTEWAEDHTPAQLADLFRAASREVHEAEA